MSPRAAERSAQAVPSPWPLPGGSAPPGSPWAQWQRSGRRGAGRLSRLWRRDRPLRLLLESDGVTGWHDAGNGLESDGRFESFARWAEGRRGSRVRLAVSGHLLHSVCLDDAALDDGDGAAESARRHFVRYHGPAAAAWPLACAGGGAVGAGTVACGLHGFDLAALRAEAERHEIDLVGAVPLWADALAGAAAAEPALGTAADAALLVVEARLVTALRLRGGNVAAIEERWLDGPTAAALLGLLERMDAAGWPALRHAVGWGLDAAVDDSRVRAIGDLDGTSAEGAGWLDRAA